MYKVVYIPRMVREDEEFTEPFITQEQFDAQLETAYEAGKVDGQRYEQEIAAAADAARPAVNAGQVEFAYHGITRQARNTGRLIPGIEGVLVELYETKRGFDYHEAPQPKHYKVDEIFALREV